MKNQIRKICLLSLTLFLAVVTASAQSEKYDAIKGGEIPAVHKPSDTEKCFVFAKYVVKTDQKDADGENVGVYRRVSTANTKNPCQANGKPYLYIKDSDNNSFYGIADRFLFIDSGTSVESRGLDIYDLNSRKSIAAKDYNANHEPSITAGRFVVYDANSSKNGVLKACKEAAKWKRNGGGVGWVQGKRLDLETLTEINVGSLRCVYME